jgi:parallel beta-helix repeat protein
MRIRRVHLLALVVLLAISRSEAVTAQTCPDQNVKCITEPTGGDCSSIGTWNAVSKTCTLTADLSGKSIQIAGDDITLDGGGHVLKGVPVGGFPPPRGIHVEQRSGVTIANLTVREFQAGIELRNSFNCTLAGNTIGENTRVGIEVLDSNHNRIVKNTVTTAGDGILLKESADNVLEGNLVESNRDSGILLNFGSNGNTVTRNTARLNDGGVALGGASGQNTLRDNDVTGNRHLGIALYFDSNENAVIGNRITQNAVGVANGAGVLLMASSGNQFTDNTVAGNSRGIWLSYPVNDAYPGGGNEIYHNNFIDNPTQALITGWRSSPDAFSKQAPIGGNFWGDWTTPDADQDGVVDSAYRINGAGDNLPWKVKNGWTIPPNSNHAK